MAKAKEEYEKRTGTWFTTVSHDTQTRETLKINCQEFPFWAWIDHRPDKGDDEEEVHYHTHVLVRTIGTRTIRQVADRLDIPSNFVQLVRQPRSLKRYFRHLDNPEKVQYSEDDVHTSNPSEFKIASIDNKDCDIRRLYNDLILLRRGELSMNDFLELHYVEVQKLNFYQKVRLFDILQAQDTT